MSHTDARTQTMHGHGTRTASPATEGREVRRFPWAAARPAEVIAHFTREAAIVARLRHPHVVPVHAAGRLPDGTPYLATERLPGRTLEEALVAGPVPAADLGPILRGVASALSAAHAAGVVHGRLSAETVFLAEMPGYRWGFPMVTDFGVARLEVVGPLDARVDQRALVALAVRAHGRPFSPDAQRVLERAAGSDGLPSFPSLTSLIETLEESVASGPAPAASPAPAPAVASPPSSLTQQFFYEGEAQDAAHAAAAATTATTDDEWDEDAAGTSPARVPRNRAQIITTTALSLGAAAIIVATVVSLSTARDVRPPAPVSVQRPPDAPSSPPRAPASGARGTREPNGAARSHQGRTAAAPRSRQVEPPQFVPSSVPPSVPAPPATTPAPAAVPAAPAPVEVSAAPAVSAPPAPVPAPPSPPHQAAPGDAPAPAPAPAAEPNPDLAETPAADDADVAPARGQTEGEPPMP